MGLDQYAEARKGEGKFATTDVVTRRRKKKR